MEKAFWFFLIIWTLLRVTLLGCQLYGNTDPLIKASVLENFTPKDITTGKNYALTGFWFKAIYGFIFMYSLILIMVRGYFDKIWLACNKLMKKHIFLTELLFVALFLFIVQVISFPFSYYFGFLKETSMGFSQMSFAQWLIFFLKGSAVGIFFQTIGIMLIIYSIKIFPKGWPAVLTIVMGLFSVVITILYPVLITPIFYNEKPLSEGSLKNKIIEIAQKAKVELSNISVIDASKYSNHTNAYFTGIGKRKKIVLYDTLIKSHPPEEAALIFAHEAGHWKHNHVFIGLSLGFGAILFMSLAAWALFPSISRVNIFYVKELGSSRSLPFFFIIAMIFQLITAPVESQISQIMEKQADWASLTYTGLTKTYVNAEKRLAKDNHSDLLPHPFRVFWLYSHPPAFERIAMAKHFKQQNE